MIHKFPIGIQTFSEIRTKGYVYVDKTEQIWRLIDQGKYFFLSRPRRFGKSLLLSTLHAYFDGRKELFEGLKIAELEKDWTPYPVLHMDLTGADYHDPDALKNRIHRTVCLWEKTYGSDQDEVSIGDRFMGVIRRACEQTGRQVALLVDEYEKPILDVLDDEALQERHRQILNGFYGGIKQCDPYLRFVLLTGVTKIGKLSVFSALNNITDLSLRADYADLCGITETELEDVFHDDILAMAGEFGLSYDEMHQRLKSFYNGYHFSKNQAVSVYNPYSLIHALADQEVKPYWYETGTPTFLIKLLQKDRPNLGRVEGVTIDESSLTQINSFTSNPLPIIYQSGYLTIESYQPRFARYVLNYPNHEVKEGFLKGLLPLVMGDRKVSEFDISFFVLSIEAGDTDAFFERIGTLLASVPYEIKLDYEVHFQNFLYLLFRLMGFYTEVETHTAKGRVDLVLKTDRYIYVMEFKRDSSAEEAMRQIREKGYADPFKADGRKLVLIGVNFASDMSALDGVLIEEA